MGCREVVRAWAEKFGLVKPKEEGAVQQKETIASSRNRLRSQVVDALGEQVGELGEYEEIFTALGPTGKAARKALRAGLEELGIFDVTSVKAKNNLKAGSVDPRNAEGSEAQVTETIGEIQRDARPEQMLRVLSQANVVLKTWPIEMPVQTNSGNSQMMQDFACILAMVAPCYIKIDERVFQVKACKVSRRRINKGKGKTRGKGKKGFTLEVKLDLVGKGSDGKHETRKVDFFSCGRKLKYLGKNGDDFKLSTFPQAEGLSPTSVRKEEEEETIARGRYVANDAQAGSKRRNRVVGRVGGASALHRFEVASPDNSLGVIDVRNLPVLLPKIDAAKGFVRISFQNKKLTLALVRARNGRLLLKDVFGFKYSVPLGLVRGIQHFGPNSSQCLDELPHHLVRTLDTDANYIQVGEFCRRLNPHEWLYYQVEGKLQRTQFKSYNYGTKILTNERNNLETYYSSYKSINPKENGPISLDREGACVG